MSQQDVIEILEKTKEPLSVSDIARLIDDDTYKISKELTRMLKYKEVCFIEIDRFKAMEKYNCKRRMRLWFINGDN